MSWNAYLIWPIYIEQNIFTNNIGHTLLAMQQQLQLQKQVILDQNYNRLQLLVGM